MINFNKKELSNLLKNTGKHQLVLSKDLIMHFKLQPNQVILIYELYYKGTLFYQTRLLFDNKNSFDNLMKVIKESFTNFVNLTIIKDKKIYQRDAEYQKTASLLNFLSAYQFSEIFFDYNKELLIYYYNGVGIISSEFDTENSRGIFFFYFKEDNTIAYQYEFLDTYDNERFDVYFPYAFIFENLLFLTNEKKHKLDIEMIHLIEKEKRMV